MYTFTVVMLTLFVVSVVKWVASLWRLPDDPGEALLEFDTWELAIPVGVLLAYGATLAARILLNGGWL